MEFQQNTPSRIQFLIAIKQTLPYIALLLFSILAGASWPAGRIVGLNLPAIPGAFYRYSITLPLFYLVPKPRIETRSFDKELHLRLAILGFLSITLYNVLFLTGVSLTSASSATLIFAITPAVTLLLSNYITKEERPNMYRNLGIATAFAGVVIIFTVGTLSIGSNPSIGNLLIFLSAIVIALYTVYSKPVFAKIDVMRFSTWNVFYGWIFLLLLVPFYGLNFLLPRSFIMLPGDVLVALLYLGVYTVYSTYAYSYGMKTIGSTRTSIFLNLIPVFGVISSMIILSEPFLLWYVPSFVLIIVGVYLVNRRKS